MKKILVMILSFMMLFAFTACNNDASTVSIPDWLANTAWSGTVSYYVNGERITDDDDSLVLEITASDDDIFLYGTSLKAAMESEGGITETISGNSYTLKVTMISLEEETAYMIQTTFTFTLIDSDTMRFSFVDSSPEGVISMVGELTKV